MANPPVPQATPAGGATTGWGPDELAAQQGNIYIDPDADPATKLQQGLSQGGVVVTDGSNNNGFVHPSRLNQFLADNPDYEKGTIFSGPDGNLAGVVKASHAGAFQKANLGYTPGIQQSAGWDPEASRFASLQNFKQQFGQEFQKDVEAARAHTFGSALAPYIYAGIRTPLRQPVAAARDIRPYIQAEMQAPGAPDWYKKYLGPAALASSDFVGGSYEPQNLAMLAASGGAARLLPNIAAVRTLNRVVNGYFAVRGAQGAQQQWQAADDAQARGDIAQANELRVGALLNAGVASDIATNVAKEVATNPQQALRDLGVPQAAQAVGRGTRAVGKATGIGFTPEELIQKAGGASVIGQDGANLPMNLRIAGPRLVEQDNIRKIDGVQAMADGAYMAAQRVWNEGYQPQIARHPNATFDASLIGDQVRNGVDLATRELFPEQGRIADDFADKFNGPITLEKAQSYLTAINQQLKSFYRMTPEQQYAAGVTSGRVSSLESAAEGLRNHIDNTLESLGETDPRGLRQEYGALKGIQRVFDKRSVVTGRQQPLNLQQILALAGGTGEAAGALFSGHPLAALGGAVPLAVTTGVKYMNSPDMLVKRGIKGLRETAGPARPLTAAGPAAVGAPSPAAPPAPAPAAAPVPVAPPWTGAGQPALQFMGGTNIPGQATANIPSFANAGQPTATPAAPAAPAIQMPGVAPEAVQAFREGATQTPAAPPRPQATPEQTAAINQAVAHVNNGVTDREIHAPLREQAYRPELEPENWQGISAEKNREGQRGLSTKEVNAPNGEYAPEVAKRHQEQVNAILGPDTGKPDPNRVVIIQGGGAASGKSEAVGKALQKEHAPIAVSDSDVIKFGSKNGGFNGAAVAGMPEADLLRQSDPLGAAARLHEESSDISKMVAKEALRRKQSIILDGVGGNVDKLAEQIAEFRDHGYRVEIHYADRDLNEALKSMAWRFQKTGRWVPPDVMAEGHRKAANAFPQVAPLADASRLRMAKAASSPDIGEGKYDVVYKDGNIYNADRWSDYLKKGGAPSGRNGLQGRGLDGQGLAGTEGGGGRGGEEIPQRPGNAESAQPSRTGGVGAAAQEGAAGGTQEVAAPGLNIAQNAPPKGRPVSVVFGGAYDPPHLGHVAAVQHAVNRLQGEGYDVQHVVVAPTADKLLAQKRPGGAGLQDRAEMSRLTFPDNINGVPVEVNTQQAADAEALPRKPRRTDLADSVQREYPDHTVINVTGADATVPGAPEQHPSLYQGAPGTKHEGYNYFTTPREEGGLSSSKIRAQFAAGEPIEGMTSEAEAYFRRLNQPQAQRIAGRIGHQPGYSPQALPRSIMNR